jgi:Flp pilus assembly protein TadG
MSLPCSAPPGVVPRGQRSIFKKLRFPRFVRRFRRDEAGAYAVEFALVSVPFFALLFAIIETAFAFWAGQVLDSTMQNAARLVLTGQAQKNVAITDITSFKQQTVCPYLPSFLDCTQIAVDVRSASSFAMIAPFKPDANGYYDISSFGYQATNPGEVVVVRAVYPFPVYTSFLGAPGTVDLNGRKRMLISVATFRNEPF